MDVSKGTIVQALADHKATAKEELSLKKGEKLKILKIQDQMWWHAQSLDTKKKGWIASSCVALEGAIELHDWCHGSISRNGSEYLLNRDKIKGSFLVRESQTQKGAYTISLHDGKQTVHYRINSDDSGHYIRSKEVFPSIPELIAHLQEHSEGIAAPLERIVPKAGAKTVVISKKMDDKWELKRKDIELGKMLGSGNFGEVYIANYTPLGQQVAVKTIKEDSMETEEFMKEAHVMKKLQHPNLVRLIGVCSDEMPFYIVTEFVSKGDLHSYLRRHQSVGDVDEKAQLYIADQVNEGMAFLEAANTIHRDLAARNCLVGPELVVKVCDFGMGRVIDDLYTAHTGAKMPIKWSAPEALCYNAFSTASDVWSFGILCWEIVTFGDTPYQGIERMDIIPKLESGYRMPRPDNCHPGFYRIMRSCWALSAKDRPSFAELRNRFEKLKAGEDDEEYEEGDENEQPPVPSRENKPAKPDIDRQSKPLPPPPKAEEGDDWRKQYTKKDFNMDLVRKCLELTRTAYGTVQKFLRYGNADSLEQDLKDIIKDGEDMTKECKKVKAKPVQAHLKACAPVLAALKKLKKPSASKLKPLAEKFRNVCKDLNKAFKDIIDL